MQRKTGFTLLAVATAAAALVAPSASFAGDLTGSLSLNLSDTLVREEADFVQSPIPGSFSSPALGGALDLSEPLLVNQSDLFAPQQGPANSGIPTSIDGLQQSVDTLTVALTLSTTEAIPPHHR